MEEEGCYCSALGAAELYLVFSVDHLHIQTLFKQTGHSQEACERAGRGLAGF